MKPVVSVGLLGPLEIYVDGSLCSLSYRRVEAALVFLAVESTASKAKENPQKAYRVFQQLIEKLPEKDKKVRPLAFANLGYSALELAQFREAYEFLETAQSLQEKKNENRFADAFILAGKACVRCAEGLYEQASLLLASAESALSELSVPSRSALAQHYGPVKKRLIEALGDSK